jgi:hypothetical protein
MRRLSVFRLPASGFRGQTSDFWLQARQSPESPKPEVPEARSPKSEATALLFLALVATAQPAFAQDGWTDRVRIGLNFGAQVDTPLLDESITLEKFFEPAPIRAEIPNRSIPFIDAGVAVRLVRNFGAAIAVSYLTNRGTATVSAEIPHRFFFNQLRPIEGQVSNVKRSELVTHLDAVYVIVSQRIDLALLGGASFFNLQQDFISDVAFNETFPYDTATFASAMQTRVKTSKTGYNVGADVTWKFSPAWGVGGLVRFSRARVPFEAAGLEFGTRNVGGLQALGGIRFIF